MPDQDNFKEGLKGTALFGSVGILNIVISIVKSKIVAVLLGPTGMGVLGLFNSSVDLINKSSNFSLRTSAIKDISGAYASQDEIKLSKTYSIFKKLIILTGLLGLLICCVCSPYLSLSSFGSYQYTASFIILAISLPVLQFSDGLNVLMQSTRHLKLLAKSNVLGHILSLLLVIPIYYLFGISGIVYTIILGYIVHFGITWFFAKEIKIDLVKVTISQAIKEGKGMLKLGLMISLQGIFVALSGYIIRAYISQTASVEEVGLYTAGFFIINTYTGIVFSGMATEYYPRLASMSEDNHKVFKAVESQGELSIMLIAPLVTTFILFGDIAILFLYSKEFQGISMMINISMLGIFFKAPSWCLGYVFLSKGDSKVFFWNELVYILYTLVLNILFYKFWGLTGMGLSFLISFFIYWIQNIIVCHYRYQYIFNISLLKILLPQLIFSTLCFLCSLNSDMLQRYLIGCIFVFASILFSYRLLRKNVDIGVLMKKFKR